MAKRKTSEPGEAGGAARTRRAPLPEVTVRAAPDRTAGIGGVSLTVNFEATESDRLEAIRLSAGQLLAKIRGGQGADAV
jgi:hypothetical protein